MQGSYTFPYLYSSKRYISVRLQSWPKNLITNFFLKILLDVFMWVRDVHTTT